MDAVKEDMQVVGVRIEDTENRVKWKTVIRCGNPWKGKCRKKKKKNYLFQQGMKWKPSVRFVVFLLQKKWRKEDEIK